MQEAEKGHVFFMSKARIFNFAFVAFLYMAALAVIIYFDLHAEAYGGNQLISYILSTCLFVIPSVILLVPSLAQIERFDHKWVWTISFYFLYLAVCALLFWGYWSINKLQFSDTLLLVLIPVLLWGLGYVCLTYWQVKNKNDFIGAIFPYAAFLLAPLALQLVVLVFEIRLLAVLFGSSGESSSQQESAGNDDKAEKTVEYEYLRDSSGHETEVVSHSGNSVTCDDGKTYDNVGGDEYEER